VIENDSDQAELVKTFEEFDKKSDLGSDLEMVKILGDYLEEKIFSFQVLAKKLLAKSGSFLKLSKL
jgi:hypothetical protein